MQQKHKRKEMTAVKGWPVPGFLIITSSSLELLWLGKQFRNQRLLAQSCSQSRSLVPTQYKHKKIQTCCLFSCQTPPNLVKERSSQSLNMSYRGKESLDNRAGNKHEQDNGHIFQPPDLIIIYNVVRLRRASVPLVHVNMAERHKEE